jgi:DNA repair photolyase
MDYRYIKVNSLLNKITTKDTLFGGNYTIDPYQNCEFGCIYCDSSFDKTIYIKSNANEILKKELKKVDKGIIIVGSVHDPYQKIEQNTKLTRDLLKTILQNNFSCHILTKSDLVLRDIDILSKIDNCTVTVSIVSLNETISNIFEKNVVSPSQRLKIIQKLNNQAIRAGVAIIPLLPFFVENELEKTIKIIKNHNARYILHKNLELKGDQKTKFLNFLKNNHPESLEKYGKLFKNNYAPDLSYIKKIDRLFVKLCKRYKIKNKV